MKRANVHCGLSKPWQLPLRDGGGSGQETPEAGRHTACDPGDQDTARLYCVVEVSCQRWGPCCWPRRQGSCRIPGRMNGAQCGGPAELRAPFVLPRVAWPLEVRLGTCWRVAVPQAVLSLCWRPPSPCSAPRLWTHKCFPAVGPLLRLGHTWNATLPSAGSIFCLC